MLSLESRRVFQNFLLFCFSIIITNHLMIGPLGNSEFSFLESPCMFPSSLSQETLN